MSVRQAPDWTGPIDPKSPIGAQVHSQIKRAILTLELAPNEALSEKELSLKLGVSRTPVREALIKLADEGLVDIFPQRGTYVSPIRVAEVMEAQFIREALEIAVVRRVARGADAAFAARLDELLRLQKQAVDARHLDDFMVLDDQFHRAFSDIAALPRSWKVIQSVKSQLDRVRYLSLPQPGHIEQLYIQHADIAAAVKANDPDGTARHMKTHLRQVFSSIDELVKQHPSLFGEKANRPAR
ncbi:GntR family transcriptional regulator [Phyllobacterium leguminum]|uniref:GntR family transcriptional regulator n=1 Tax=Phyllobacterium leguminum TaxID=314237 RepID=A0A318TE00_9HYPH|nr:GntR family transcriptional regulator [Phyllobacterium leguminum]PYE86593.1 GntR family transcriptional regulator [Phyllobacterium leguminum]